MKTITGITLLLGLALAPGTARAQQPLSLREALQIAEAGAFGNRIAHAQADVQRGQTLEALRGILPTLRLEAGFARTTDPIGAFGTTLRQRQIRQADFDPQRLNHPNAIDNYSSAVVVEAPLVNADAHLGRLAGGHAAKAANASAEWAVTNTKVAVIHAYYGAVFVAERARTLEAALKASEAHVRQAEQMLKAGLVTRSDALLARVKAAEIHTQLLEARGETGLARQGLAVLLGRDPDSHIELPTELPAATAVRRALEHMTSEAGWETRADLLAAHSGVRAARYDIARAKSLYAPRLNAIARYDWNSARQPFGGDNNWTVGVMATWTPFAGASEIAERRVATARAEAAAASLDAARGAAELELRRAAVQRDVALERLAIAAGAVQQSAEAHRIVARKYQGGVATAFELLQAAAVETQSQVMLAQARYLGLVSVAESLKARGADPAILAELMNAELVGAQQ
jgi:outer membrane protein